VGRYYNKMDKQLQMHKKMEEEKRGGIGRVRGIGIGGGKYLRLMKAWQ
jgi:hypothetical protein